MNPLTAAAVQESGWPAWATLLAVAFTCVAAPAMELRVLWGGRGGMFPPSSSLIVVAGAVWLASTVFLPLAAIVLAFQIWVFYIAFNDTQRPRRVTEFIKTWNPTTASNLQKDPRLWPDKYEFWWGVRR